MRLAGLLSGSKTHALGFFPPAVVANVEKHLADKDGKPAIRRLVRSYKYGVRRLAVEVPVTLGRDTSRRAVEAAIERDEKAALESLAR